MFRNSVLFFCFLTQTLLHCQSNTLDLQTLVKGYEDYFKVDRKNVHIHLNKTVFAAGEHIWFSAFLFNQTKNNSSEGQEFIYVDLIQPNGELLLQKTILYENGLGAGDLFLANTLPTGLYFLQAYTSSMQGFEEDTSTKYPILITNFSNGDFSNYEYRKRNEKPEVAVVIEGGNLIDGRLQNGAIRMIDTSGELIQPDSIHLTSSKTGLITKIAPNTKEVHPFSIAPKVGHTYALQLFKNGQKITEELPTVKPVGVTLSFIRNPKREEVLINVFDTRVKSNKSNNPLYLLLHKDKNILPFVLAQQNASTTSQLKIPYSLLTEGMNSISILDSYGSVQAERIFFQPSNEPLNSIEITQATSKNDSLLVSLNPKNNGDFQNQKLSISVLPGNTKAQHHRKNAFFALHLESYFEGADWRALWKEDFSTFQDLEFIDKVTLFATPKYNWNHILNKNLVVPDSNFFTGALEGVVEQISTKSKPQSVLLYSKENEVMRSAPVVNGKFVFHELSMFKGSKLNLSLIGDNGKPQKANFSYTIKPAIKNFRHRFKTSDVHKTDIDAEELFEMAVASQNTQQLEEVTVTAKKLSYEKFFPGFFGVKVDSAIGVNTLKDFIRNQGFQSILVSPTAKGRRAGTLQMAKKSQRCGTIFPAIIFDGFYDAFFSPYEDIRMEYVDEIYWDRGAGCSMLLVVFTNEKYRNRPLAPHKITSKEIIADKGYDPPKPFNRPAYFNTDTLSFEHFGILGWKTTNSGETSLLVPKDNQKSIRIIIEGVSPGGKIISEDKVIALN